MTCIREDGSSTGMASTPFFVAHDLMHYAVESELGAREAFYGLLAAGWELDSFEERVPGTGKVRLPPRQALEVERVVGVLDFAAANPDPLSAAEVVELISQSFVAIGEELPSFVTSEFVDRVRSRRADLAAEWQRTLPGAVMELRFPS